MTDRRIDCEEALRQVFEFIDHELAAPDRAAMERHLSACKSCYSRTEFERLLKQRVGELGDEDASPHLSQRIRGLLRGF